MLRQRLRSRPLPSARIAADGLVVIFALALIWGGALLVALALKASPATIDRLSGYRAAYDYLARLEPQDIGSSTRTIALVAGLAACLAFGYLAWRTAPRPYLARVDLRLAAGAHGSLDVNPRAIERAVEIAALAHPAVAAARARHASDHLTLQISATRADGLAATLADAHRRARESLARHELPPLPVNIALVGMERQNRRELQ